MILSSNKNGIMETRKTFAKILNFVQIYPSNRKVIVESFYRTENLTTVKAFESYQTGNLSKILFPDKAKNLNGFPLFAVYRKTFDIFHTEEDKPYSLWTPYLQILTEKLNATIKYKKIPKDSDEKFRNDLLKNHQLDFYLNFIYYKFDLESYHFRDWCLLAGIPPKFSIHEKVLFKPLDKHCWIYLGTTLILCAIIWKISEGHWNFLFGILAFFVGQSSNIKT